MKKRIIYATMSFALLGSIISGCSNTKEDNVKENEVKVEGVEKNEDVKEVEESKGKKDLGNDKIIENVDIEKNADGLYEIKMFNIFGGMIGEESGYTKVEGDYIIFLLDDSEYEEMKKEYEGLTVEVIEELNLSNETDIPIVNASFDKNTMTISLDVDTSVDEWENSIGMFMWVFDSVAVPESALEGIISNFGIDYIIKDSKTGELLEVDGGFSFNESIDFSNIDLDDVELGEGVTISPLEDEDKK